jgi:hypothetical protein
MRRPDWPNKSYDKTETFGNARRILGFGESLSKVRAYRKEARDLDPAAHFFAGKVSTHSH